ncbi:hypothetical protein AVEN_194948-1 [Araneus ventricosus]|uniref:Reverse transcriptase domain-containing protein n=1 Tax=Araneus ventricosus TaxID=182803 RepID=A0A4Y2EVP7_ARAVE|nr:hypothetical protein AVEN_194948-1 [Araneus ventricosus]
MAETNGLRQFLIFLYKGSLLRKRHYIITFFEIVIPILIATIPCIILSKTSTKYNAENYQSSENLGDKFLWVSYSTYLPFDPFYAKLDLRSLEFVYTPMNAITEQFINDSVKMFQRNTRYKDGISFADDLALVSACRVREELENNTNKALDAIANKLRELKLDMSVDKCQGLAFRSNVHYRQSIFNRNPIFKISGQSVKIGNSLKYLGILLDWRLTWSNHILSLHKKIYKMAINFNRFMKANWNIDKHLVKFWYISVIELPLLCGAGVWSGALTVEQINRLHTIQ